MTSEICANRVAVVTGAGAGLGRAYALALAAAGASVVVNDINRQAAQQVVDEISSSAGQPTSEPTNQPTNQPTNKPAPPAVLNTDDITDHAAAGNIVAQALEQYGALHAVVNNAGICRDRMFVSLEEEDWDAVVRVHLKGHYCLSSQACRHWRQLVKTGGEPVDARIINTSSGAGLQGSLGQSNYSAAKGAIATLTLVQAAELARYGITANALAPSARTNMTTQVEEFAQRMKKPEDGSFDHYDPGNIAPLVVWLASPASAAVSGRVFELEGGQIGLVDAWRAGPVQDKGARWQPEELGAVVDQLIADTLPPQKVYGT